MRGMITYNRKEDDTKYTKKEIAVISKIVTKTVIMNNNNNRICTQSHVASPLSFS